MDTATNTGMAAVTTTADAGAVPAKGPYKTPRVVKFFDNGLDIVIIALVLFLVAFSGYAHWDTTRMTSGALPDQYEIYNPADNPMSFEELRAINPDVFGWITVFGTNIDFPLVQGRDNSFYLNHNAKGEFSLAGAIFLDVANDRNFTDFNNIIHGHHMEGGAKFGNLDLFVSREFFDSRLHGNLFFNDKDHGLEFFAFMETSGYNWRIFNPAISDPERQQDYLDAIDEYSMHTRDIGITTDDTIVLLATCTSDSTNGRHLLVARLTDEPFPNPFAQTEAEIERQNFVDAQLLPFLRTVCMPMLLVIILLVIAYQLYARRKRWNVEDRYLKLQAQKNGANGANGANGGNGNGANSANGANGAANGVAKPNG